MGSFIHLGFAAVLAGLFIYVLQLQGVRKFLRVLLLLVIGPLVYDNAISGIGFLIGEGNFLKALNIPRFVLHVFVTPLICVIAYEFARGFRVAIAERGVTQWIVWGLTAILIIIGFVQELSPLDLIPKTHLGALRYTHPVPAPPIAAIVVNFFVIAASTLIWRKSGWPGLFITSMLMLLAGGIPQKLLGLLPGNAGEIIFISGFMLALKRLAAGDRPEGQSP
jgi:hypothetical protein